jgi:hypothetical protein
VVESSDSDSEDDSPTREVIDLISDSDSDDSPPQRRTRKPEANTTGPKLSLYEDMGDDELEANTLYYQRDEAILVL